ncbi:hypothetical protein [Bradyrhizobium sp. STM 3809]|uniref:hypothetical protein n=1 Tax=Bradyrhizobium sp. STM 3809 TaxID=551936 RepID=UPI00024082CE|nr:hypothetical protein [Bradyrhizobium sp. STM 3809]CCE03757.1 conserved hypothetical protein [Bradyrhizobium sp. STM 3809]
MANRRHSARRVKRLRTYNVREAAKVTGATAATVRHWLTSGLHAVEGCYPTIVRGADLIDFLKRRNTDRKNPCGPGRLFCLRCKEPRRPAFDEVEFWPSGPRLGSLRGICPSCTGMMNRRTSTARIKAATADLRVSFPLGDPSLGEPLHPRSNPHSERV